MIELPLWFRRRERNMSREREKKRREGEREREVDRRAQEREREIDGKVRERGRSDFRRENGMKERVKRGEIDNFLIFLILN